MRAFVGVTDRDWYEYLRARPWINEVNFWNPGGVAFRALDVGEPFLFKSHHPHNRLVGGGAFSGFARLKLSEAWRIFGEGNGAESLQAMRHGIRRYRRDGVGPEDDPEIGCTIIRDVIFAQDADLLDAPPDFAKNIVRGKGYEVARGSSFVEDSFAMLLAQGEGTAGSVPGQVFGDGVLVANRLGQRAVKALILTAYQRRCAVTGTRIVPALQAAHIRPVTEAGENRTDNGLLLRSDVHAMSTVATSASTPATGCGSAPGCDQSSATASGSTHIRGRSSTCRRVASIDPRGLPWSGTWTWSSRRPDRQTYAHGRARHQGDRHEDDPL